uniref:CRAL-TRIO domain-containing protein n=1 Tax=Anopheles atroparvus TaxID=41427 RepID=A0A182IQM4_ANOAO
MSDRVAYSVDKNRKVEERYTFTLPELYRNIALQELNEEDVVREQAVTQMREWIVSNPHIRKCRVDTPFLLRFLRFRKFSVPLACEALEQYLTVREMYPSWYKNLNCNHPIMRRMQETNGISVLGQDSAGRTVVLMQTFRMEKGRFTALQEGRFIFLLLEALLELEEVQIGGLVVLIDYTGKSTESCKTWGATELKISFDGVFRFYPVRYQAIHAANLPKTIVSFVEYKLTFIPPNFKEKIHCHATVDKFKKLLEPLMIPQVYGGSVDLDELNKRFWERFQLQYDDFVVGLDKFELNLDHYSAVARNLKKLNSD